MSGCDEMPLKLRMKKFGGYTSRRYVTALVAYQSSEHEYLACPYCWKATKDGVCVDCGWVGSIVRVMRRYIIYTADDCMQVAMCTRYGALETNRFYELEIAESPTGDIYVIGAEAR